MKKFRIFWVLLCVLLLTTTVVSAFDTVHPGHNSDFYLDYGSGYTLCVDTSSSHSYLTYARAHNTQDTRVAVYVLNSSGTVVASANSNEILSFADAWWTRDSATSHGHRATSALIAR